MRRYTDKKGLQELSRDAGIHTIIPRLAILAETESDVAQAMEDSAAEGLPVTARGGGTSIPSQSVGGGAILLQRRNAIRVSRDAVVCQPGVVKAELNRALSREGRWMPVDPSSYASCMIGGMVANNSSGARTMKYGSTVDYVEALRAVFPGGKALHVAPVSIEEALSADVRTRSLVSLLLENQKTIAQERPRVSKNSSGYRLERAVHDGVFDLPRLLVGSEGTLCVFTEATLATRVVPKWRLLLIVESPFEELDRIVSVFGEHSPSAIELVDKSVFRLMGRWERVSKYSRTGAPYLLFIEFDGESGDASSKMEELAGSKVGSFDPLVLQSQAEISDAWEVRSETLTIAQDVKRGTKTLVPGVEDLVVPRERLGDLVKLLADQFESRGLEYISYGHAGDANLHARPLLDITDSRGGSTLDSLMEECFEAVWKMGGSMTGEHGDGMLRAKFVERQYPKTYWIMREIKSLFDPKGVLNPGVKIIG